MKGPGLKPPQIGRFKREVIGPDECPIMYRWTILSTRFGKLLVHRFLPNADDRAVHDHPRSFVTFILSGGYVDLQPCPFCARHCVHCDADGLVVGDRLRRGAIRFRRATHQHRTRVAPNGCWSLVIMGPLVRQWGFWHEGKFWLWQEFERRFGYGMRCPE